VPVDKTTALYSDWFYQAALVVYLLTLVLTFVEHGFGARTRGVAEQDAMRVRHTVTTGGPPSPPPESSPPAEGRAERVGKMGAALLVLGCLLHLAAIVLRAVAASRAPWGNMYEYVMVATFIATCAWGVIIRKQHARHLTGFLLGPIVLLMFINGTLLYTDAAPVQPALRSYWLAVHVSSVSVGSGVFLVSGVANLLYLLRVMHERGSSRIARIAVRFPSAEVLDRIAYRSTIVGFPVFTFGVLCGAVWAEAAWGRFWGWDPKETAAFVTWIVYAAYLHSRATAGWRGARAAIVNLIGFGCTVFNLFFVNLVTTGLHSYAGT
jgi:cytochrome c-type biogenesis protein CcsB